MKENENVTLEKSKLGYIGFYLRIIFYNTTS